MQFSMKWLLAGMVYVAVVAAAFSQPGWAYAELLWLTAAAALVYCILLACYARGQRQAGAAGFAVAFLGYLACLQFAPHSLPTAQALAAVGLGRNDSVVTMTPMPPMVIYPQAPTPYQGSGGMQPPVYAPPMQVQPTPIMPYVQADLLFPQRLRAAHAVATTWSGVAGSLLGLLAFRRTLREAARADAPAGIAR